MGAGIALEFKLRLPDMFDRYVELCRRRLIDIGKLWLYKPPLSAGEQRWVLNIPTKRHWKRPSTISYLEAGLEKFLRTYQEQSITSIAFPLLGATNGGLSEDDSLSVMKDHLVHCGIPVEIYRYDPKATDDLYDDFRKRMLNSDRRRDDTNVAKAIGLRIDLFQKICDVLEHRRDINSLTRLLTVKGIGVGTLEKCSAMPWVRLLESRRRPKHSEPLTSPSPPRPFWTPPSHSGRPGSTAFEPHAASRGPRRTASARAGRRFPRPT